MSGVHGKWLGGLACAALAASVVVTPVPARAIGRDTRTLVAGAGYGMAVGTVVGLASYPFSKDARTIFMGTALGLYVGLGIGVYYIIYRDDPGNPLRQAADQGSESSEPRGLADSRMLDRVDRTDRFNDPRPPELVIAVPVIRF